jgi:hypothetical protein
VHDTGNWEPSTWFDAECARRDRVCSELERIDELRYRFEDQWDAFHASEKQSEKQVDRKRKRKPGVLTEVMRNAKRQAVELEAQVKGPKEMKAGDQVLKYAIYSEIVARHNRHAGEEIADKKHQPRARNTSNQQLCETSTDLVGSSIQDDEWSSTFRHKQKSYSPETADSFESSSSCDLPTRNAAQLTPGTVPDVAQGTRNERDRISISRDAEDVPPQAPCTKSILRANKLAIDAGFGNYSFLNSLEDDDRHMWSAFLAERRIADHAMKNIANLFCKPRSPDFTRRLIKKLGKKYPECKDSSK